MSKTHNASKCSGLNQIISLISIFFGLIFSSQILAISPTETLQLLTDRIIIAAKSATKNEQLAQEELSQIIHDGMDFEKISKRILSKHWDLATEAERAEFKGLFRQVLVRVYFKLVKDYDNEKVIFLKEVMKDESHAIVDSEIVSTKNKIPVRYRLILKDNEWKVYDFIPEGVSFVNSYKNNYVLTLNNSGMQGLLVEMSAKNTK